MQHLKLTPVLLHGGVFFQGRVFVAVCSIEVRVSALRWVASRRRREMRQGSRHPREREVGLF